MVIRYVLFLLYFGHISIVIISCMSVYEQKKYAKQLESQPQQGLYDNSDLVIDLNVNSLRERIFEQNYASYVEFYNSYCGFCRRFASKWKAVAENVTRWDDILKVFAIDCSDDKNNDICREFEVMAYPTIRYFSPNSKDGVLAKETGKPINVHEENSLVDILTKQLQNETVTPDTWPNLQSFQGQDTSLLFEGLPDQVQYIFLIIEKTPSNPNHTLPSQVILDFAKIKEIKVRRCSEDVPLGVKSIPYISNFTMCVLNRALEVESLTFEDETRSSLATSITNYLKTVSINYPSTTAKFVTAKNKEDEVTPNIFDIMSQKQDQAIYEKTKKHHGVVYRADIEQAVRYSLFHEIPQQKIIDGDNLLALQQYLSVIARYFPFCEKGKKFIAEIRTYVMDQEKEVHGDQFRLKLVEAELKNNPVFASTRYVGCWSKIQGLRRFPCGLWTMFHFMTVQAYESEFSTDPLEILQAMHNYVKFFFGCSDCSKHFQTMATKNKIWNVTSKDEAILWLWKAHNDVNKRLSGDLTEDPDHKKLQFPSVEMCLECVRTDSENQHNTYRDISDNGGFEWNKLEVLQYLKKMYALSSLDDLGVDDDRGLPNRFTYTQSKRFFGSIFSDLDIRVGLLLYGCCICMMGIAVKIFVNKRRYRRRLYLHDLLGKV